MRLYMDRCTRQSNDNETHISCSPLAGNCITTVTNPEVSKGIPARRPVLPLTLFHTSDSSTYYRELEGGDSRYRF